MRAGGNSGQIEVGIDVKAERHTLSAFAFDAEGSRIVGGHQVTPPRLDNMT